MIGMEYTSNIQDRYEFNHFQFSHYARNMIVSDIQCPNPDYKTTMYATIPEIIFAAPVRSRLLCVGRERDRLCTIYLQISEIVARTKEH